MNKEQEPRTRSDVEEELAQLERAIKELDPLKFRKLNDDDTSSVSYRIKNDSYEITLSAYFRKYSEMSTPTTMTVKAKETGNVHSYQGPIVKRIFYYVQESSRACTLQDITSKLKQPTP